MLPLFWFNAGTNWMCFYSTASVNLFHQDKVARFWKRSGRTVQAFLTSFTWRTASNNAAFSPSNTEAKQHSDWKKGLASFKQKDHECTIWGSKHLIDFQCDEHGCVHFTAGLLRFLRLYNYFWALQKLVLKREREKKQVVVVRKKLYRWCQESEGKADTLLGEHTFLPFLDQEEVKNILQVLKVSIDVLQAQSNKSWWRRAYPERCSE